MIIGCDFHPRFQQISFLLEETGECGQRRLMHTAEVEQYYRTLRGARVRVGIEATGSYGWFRRLLSELGHDLLVGDATQIRASNPRRQKTDKRDAEHILGCWWRIVSPSSGSRRQRTNNCGNSCCIAVAWSGCARG